MCVGGDSTSPITGSSRLRTLCNRTCKIKTEEAFQKKLATNVTNNRVDNVDTVLAKIGVIEAGS